MTSTVYLILILQTLLSVLLNVHALCLTGEIRICLESIPDEEANERLEYILSKYEEVEMKITGTPIGVHGKRIAEGDTEELHIVFQYIDNTVHDIMQTCTFILTTRPQQCETISTVCNTFLPTTPRPLLKREDLTVCDDDETATDRNGSGASAEAGRGEHSAEQPNLAS